MHASHVAIAPTRLVDSTSARLRLPHAMDLSALPSGRSPPTLGFVAVLLVGLGCDPPIVDPPPLGVLGTGAFVGEVFVGGDSIEGATIEILGSSARASSASGRQFALYPVTVGTHTIAIRDPSGRAARFDVNLPTENLTVLLAPADTTLEPPTRISGSITLPANASPAGAVAFIVGGSVDS